MPAQQKATEKGNQLSGWSCGDNVKVQIDWCQRLSINSVNFRRNRRNWRRGEMILFRTALTEIMSWDWDVSMKHD